MDDPVLDIFREEAREHLGALEKLFLDLEAAHGVEARRQLINHLFRRAHSLKGDAKVVGLGELKKAAQQLEDILDELRENPEHIDRVVIDRGLSQFDLVRQAFETWQSSSRIEPAAAGVDTLIPAMTMVEPALAVEDTPGISPPNTLYQTSRVDESFTVRVPSERLDRMLNLAGEVRICQRSADALAVRLAELRQHLTALLKTFARQSATENRQSVEAALDQVRRIDGDLRKKRAREELLAESLELDIREARLLPLAMLADSLRRAARDLAQSLGKSIRYEVDVGKILLDKAVIESLKDPLLHLIRNAADHGIEAPPERRAAGKSAEGVIRLTAVQWGPLVQIAISDDGRGVNFDRVREHVRRRSELNEVDLVALSQRDLASYLFQPGFSTASAGEVSGRGVGLDVVRDSVRRLQGTVELQASSSSGSNFAITVPVTVSTVRIMTVVTGGQYFGVPTTAIRKTGRARQEDLRDLEGCPVLPIDGQPVRWVHLAQLLGIQESNKIQNEPARSYLLVRQQDREIAVAVEDMEDESEVLLKPLGFPLGGLPGTVGATIRADGSVQLVLDLTSSEWTKADVRAARPRVEQQASRRILIADDSPTTRAVLRNVFTAAGYLVTTATDGIDALEQLRARPVDLVVSDVDMPRLNGFDLTRQVKSKFRLPVILVTGQERDEHRREGLAAGADAYVVKSTFEDQGLLDIVRQFL
jgi:two-component system chemotaxis sensor kinase CheA